MTTYPLFAMSWTEYERGWGPRPDGYTFHASVADFRQFLNDFQARQPAEVPDEYSQANGETPLMMMVSESLYQYVMENGSVWLHYNSPEKYTTFDASRLKPQKHGM